MSHELRTPLNAILGYSDLLTAEIAGPITPGQAIQLNRIDAGARHLLQIIEEILTFSRVEAGREEARLARVDLAELAREAGTLIEPLAVRKGLRIVCDVPERLEAHTDGAKVRQILLNLLSNSIKFTERGEIGLELDEDGGYARLRVTDTGIGIDPEHLGAIFEPFSQIGRTGPARTEGGTGLGLTVSKSLAELLGGEITVASVPGQGSTFTVRLPRRR
jgi:signal transduction histidine kinase